MMLNFLEVEDIVRRALQEDVGSGDITTALTIPWESESSARIVARENGVLAGIQVAAMVFKIAAESYGPYHSKEPAVTFTPLIDDCSVVKAGQAVAEISGSTAIILTAERVALNLLQRMSGIATKTAKSVKLTKHTGVTIVDTRKTTPGLRVLEKYAVRCGGGRNHRFGLYDAVLIKDNHVAACGGINQAVQKARQGTPHTIKIEVETDTVDQVREALEAGADMILLDNMNASEIRECVALCSGLAVTEASGGINEKTIVEIAETGVNLISVGALTHSVKSLDFGLDMLE